MKPEIRIFKNLEGLSRAAAELFVEQAAQSILERSGFLVALNGGSTPMRLFQLLAADFRANVEWSKVHVFWGDERCVLPEDAGSNYRQAWHMLLSQVPMPSSNIHRIKGELGPVEAAKDYSLILKKFASLPLAWPRFDLVYLGLGDDGHTASLFPGSHMDVLDPVLPVTAHYQDRPANRVTLTPPVFNSARVVAFMATGAQKADVLAEVIGGNHNPEQYPAQRIDPADGKLIWLVDKAAAGKLPKE